MDTGTKIVLGIAIVFAMFTYWGLNRKPSKKENENGD